MKKLFLLLCLITTQAFSQNVKTYIPPKAHELIPVVKTEVARFAPEILDPWYFPGLIEHESCISLKHSRCWNTNSELRNNREHGLGLFQMTRAWDEKTGKLRFDNLTYLSKKYRTHLEGVHWGNYKERVDLQIRSGILLWMEGFNGLSGMDYSLDKLKFSDSAFNGGLSHVKKARQVCQLTKNCDPLYWEQAKLYLPKSKTPDKRYGGKSMYEINTNHVHDVFNNRMEKYKVYWKE